MWMRTVAFALALQVLLNAAPATAQDCGKTKEGCFSPEMKRICMTFDGKVPVGSKQPVGWTYDENGIQIRVDPITRPDGSQNAGGFVMIDAAPPQAFASGNALRFNNANILIGLLNRTSILGYDIDYLDMGGYENLSTQGNPPQVGDLQSIAPADNVSISVNPVQGGFTGRLTKHIGRVKALLGGQELWIDNICVYLK